MISKYVMTDSGPIVFPMSIQHCAFADFKPTSAGIVAVSVAGDEISCACYGNSLTLGLDPAPGDSEKILQFFKKGK